MTTPEIILADHGTDLSSRITGVAIRQAILSMLRTSTARITVNCAGVRTLSESFADEVFAVLVAEHGKPWFKQHVIVTGLAENTRAAILRAIAERLHLDPAA